MFDQTTMSVVTTAGQQTAVRPFRWAAILLLLTIGCQRDDSAGISGSPKPAAKTGIGLPDDVSPVDLVKDGAKQGSYIHTPSGTGFRIPDGWEHSEPRMKYKISFLKLSRARDGLKVTLSWTPMRRNLASVVATETRVLWSQYGKQHVESPEQIEIAGKSGWRIRLTKDSSGAGTGRGLVYLFSAGDDGKHRWKVKLRATLDRNAEEQTVEDLLKRIRWSLSVYGPPEP